MSIYRVKQFLWAITAGFKKVDNTILNKYLDEKEIYFFKKLKISEQHHCIRVCKDALMESNNWRGIDKRKLAKIALLHDVGKIYGHLNIIDKSIMVILDKVTKSKLSKYTFINKVDIYYNHPKKSVDLLTRIGNYEYDKEFLEAIEKHHHKNTHKNNYLKIIKRCDDNN